MLVLGSVGLLAVGGLIAREGLIAGGGHIAGGGLGFLEGGSSSPPFLFLM